MGAKVLVFGVDAMELSLVDAWIDDGSLPNLASLREQGLFGVVRNPPRRFSGASWPNFYTAVGPHRHGQYLRTRFNPEDYRYHGYRPDHDRMPAFWTDAAWREKRIAVINMPYAPVHEGLNGMQVTEWGVHDYHHRTIRTWPASLADDVLSKYGGDPVGLCEIDDRTPAEFQAFRENLLKRVRAKRDMICHYLRSDHWDLFVSVMDEAHCVGHQTWHLHDPSHPRHDSDIAAAMGDPMKDVYREIDAAFGAIRDCVDDDCTILFVSTHGMGPTSDGNLVFDDILRRIEGIDVGGGPQAISAIKRVQAALPAWLRDLLQPIKERISLKVTEELRKGDRAKRQYFSIPTQDPAAGVRFNLAGRENHGLVEPGEQYDAVVEHLSRELHALTDGRTGKPLVERIIRQEDLDLTGYDGNPPDLIVQWAVMDPPWIQSPTLGRIDPIYNNRAGDHRMLGFMMAAGPTVRPGQLDHTVALEDFASTIAGLLGLDVAETDGAPIQSISPGGRKN